MNTKSLEALKLNVGQVSGLGTVSRTVCVGS